MVEIRGLVLEVANISQNITGIFLSMNCFLREGQHSCQCRRISARGSGVSKMFRTGFEDGSMSRRGGGGVVLDVDLERGLNC